MISPCALPVEAIRAEEYEQKSPKAMPGKPRAHAKKGDDRKALSFSCISQILDVATKKDTSGVNSTHTVFFYSTIVIVVQLSISRSR
jgi:hypothetical protein